MLRLAAHTAPLANASGPCAPLAGFTKFLRSRLAEASYAGGTVPRQVQVNVISSRSKLISAGGTAARTAFTVGASLAILACSDPSGPRPAGPGLRIVPVADSVFEGDVVRLTVQAAADPTGAATASVTWAVSDTTLATISGDGTLTLVRPGVVRITARGAAAAIATYDLTIGRLVVKRLELMPADL